MCQIAIFPSCIFCVFDRTEQNWAKYVCNHNAQSRRTSLTHRLFWMEQQRSPWTTAFCKMKYEEFLSLRTISISGTCRCCNPVTATLFKLVHLCASSKFALHFYLVAVTWKSRAVTPVDHTQKHSQRIWWILGGLRQSVKENFSSVTRLCFLKQRRTQFAAHWEGQNVHNIRKFTGKGIGMATTVHTR